MHLKQQQHLGPTWKNLEDDWVSTNLKQQQDLDPTWKLEDDWVSTNLKQQQELDPTWKSLKMMRPLAATISSSMSNCVPSVVSL